MRITELDINDFKFFQQVEADSPLLRIDEKNLLIFGENGSGKSSIYWALYTFFEASFKTSDAEIKKYFLKTGKSSLVNIHSVGSSRSYLKVKLKENEDYKTYRVSHKPSGLRIRGNVDVQESNMASDFINYRVLFELHNLKHSKSNDLWPWFEHEILPYVRKGTDNCLEILELLKQGPEKVNNLAGEQVFPVPSLRTSANAAERNNYRFYKEYKDKVNEWISWLNNLLSQINTLANQMLEDDFDFRLKIELSASLKFPEFDATSNSVKWHNPVINLNILEYEGIVNPNITRPHSFLNEAKWSAIGISIRFSILDIKLYTAELKCLVIDDMLLSLDMVNREIVVNLILTKYSPDYQVFFLTHDKFLFEFVKYKLKSAGLSGNWKSLEMYEDETSATPKPIILEAKPQLEKAWAYYYSREYPSSANTLRKAVEKLCKQYLDPNERLTPSFSVMNLHQMIEKLIQKGTANGLDAARLISLTEYKDRILNPSSHYDIVTPIFRNELKKGLETVEAIAQEMGYEI